jgi:hypothetical protein
LYIRSRRQCGNFQGACVSCSRRALSTGFVPLRLPHAVKDLFADRIARHFPDRKEKIACATFAGANFTMPPG